MKNITSNNNCGCGEKESSSIKPDTFVSRPKGGPGMAISSSGVSIMASMDDACKSSCSAPKKENPKVLHQKPGYTLCHYVDGFTQTATGPVPVIKARLDFKDRVSTFFVRCGINRYSYTVSPGLYAVGKPDKNSEVLVTANFKLTLDHLRKELSDVSAWILVLDTQGINVWCAAGKGTFATPELVRQIKRCHLEQIVDHNRLIVPQLGATGVSARKVKQQSGFKVIYGPVRASDIPAFLKNNKTADKTMRQVTFSLYERFILTPVEIQIVLKPALITALVLFFVSGFGPDIFSFSALWERGWFCFLAMVTGIFSGAVITPLLLPFVPSRQFAVKGIITGSVLALLLFILITFSNIDYQPGAAGYTALFLFSVSISSFLAMNFTGTTPFTSPTGVELEMRRFIPVQLAALVISTGLWIYSAF